MTIAEADPILMPVGREASGALQTSTDLAIEPMFIFTTPPTAGPWVNLEADLRRFLPPAPVTARSEHARMLGIAAARRLRALERSAHDRPEDADYWKAVAPAALRKAAALRADAHFLALPS